MEKIKWGRGDELDERGRRKKGIREGRSEDRGKGKTEDGKTGKCRIGKEGKGRGEGTQGKRDRREKGNS